MIHPTMPVNASCCLAGGLLEQAVCCGRYEEAFQRVLNLEDIGMVAWLCSQLDPGSILSQSPPVLSQLTLLSLTQQLGTDLQKVIVYCHTFCLLCCECARNTGRPQDLMFHPTFQYHSAHMQSSA